MCSAKNSYQHVMSERMLEFAIKIMELEKHITKSYSGKHIYGQIFRSGTSAGANFEESIGAYSKSDFIYKTQIVLKELRETAFWIKLIFKSEITHNSILISFLLNESTELAKIFGSSLVTAKGLKSKNS